LIEYEIALDITHDFLTLAQVKPLLLKDGRVDDLNNIA